MRDRQGAYNAIIGIKSALEDRLHASEPNKNLGENYIVGIQLCDDMAERVKGEGFATGFEALFAEFIRYSVDSMPWDKELLAVIDRAQKQVKSSLSE